MKDVFGNVTKLCYNTFNVPVKVIDANGIVTEYAYNDAGLVASAVLKDGAETIASVTVAYDKNRHTNTYPWDGLALIQRGDEHFLNEPHIGNAPKKLRFGGKPRAQRSVRRARKGPRGNPVVSSNGTSYFNDMLGTTVGAKKGAKYSAAALTAFGARELEKEVGVGERRENLFFTGKPEVAGLGHAFLMRNYRAGLAKWQTADPLGYPDGWNALAYCRNGVICCVDLSGCVTINLFPENEDIHRYADNYNPANEITVGGHGSGSQGVIAKSVSELAELIRTNSSFDGKTNVWLYSCFVANGSYAQELANELGVKVWAADNYVWFDETGYFGIFPKLPDGSADYLHHGNWVAFRPE